MKKTKKNAAGCVGDLLIYPDIDTAVPLPDKEDGRNWVECRDVIIKFRTYLVDKEGNRLKDEKGRLMFKDYKIHHHDLRVQLLDGVFIEDEDGRYIDYDLDRYKDYATE